MILLKVVHQNIARERERGTIYPRQLFFLIETIMVFVFVTTAAPSAVPVTKPEVPGDKKGNANGWIASLRAIGLDPHWALAG
jgi:hypothetical protein